jgi:hypothetical protein
MYGYFDRIEDNRLATGTLDPLYARILVLEAGDERVALVTLDLGRTFGLSSLATLGQAVKQRGGITGLIVTASHTHAGPNILDEYPGKRPPPWEAAALAKIEDGVAQACQRLVAVRIGTGYGSVFIGYNRRRVNSDGTVEMLWTNPTRVPTAPVDPTVSVLRIDTVDGRPLAVLVNYACHPVIFGPDNLQYSADYVGVMAKVVEAALADQPVCFFLQGADGDINPYDATTPLVDDAVKKRDWTGQQLGNEAASVARSIQTSTDPEGSLQFSEEALPVRLRWDPEKFRLGLLQAFGPKVFEDHADLLADHALQQLDLTVTTLLLDRRIAFVGMPGEPFVDFQMNWRIRCPVRDAFFLGYTNGYFDYFPTMRAATEGGYGAGDSNTYVAVGTAERMLDRGLERIYTMLGRLQTLPEDLKREP